MTSIFKVFRFIDGSLFLQKIAMKHEVLFKI